MYSLRVLGGLSLEDAAGPVTSRATQRRRLAMLAMLARAPQRTLSRDRLIAYLWPESDTEQARHLLSVALYEMRKGLAEELLVARGDEVVLDSERVRVDAEAFERALDGGEPETAVALYAGAFLDGFFLSDAPEFERWVEGERQRLEHRYRDALERVAEAHGAAGDARGAVEAWRRVAALDPYSSRIALQLMRALATAGDRAGALQHARVHELLLREEFGTSPDAEVTALAERLREEPGVPPSSPPVAPSAPPPPVREVEAEAPAEPAAAIPSTPAAPSLPPPPAPPARPRRVRRLALAAVVGGAVAVGGLWMAVGRQPETPSIAVLPFSDLSPGRDFEYFGEGLAEEILDALSRVEGLDVAARTSSFVLRQRGMDVVEVGERLRVRSVLEGSVRRSGDRLRVRVGLVDEGSGDYLWSEEYERRMDDVLRMQDEITLAVVSALKGRLVERDSAQAIHVATRDPQAYDLYLRGRAYWYRRTAEGFQGALASFRGAVARDPGYALAHVGLADVYALLASPDYGVLPPKEAFPRARAELSRALELDPRSAEAHAALGNVLTFYDHDWAEAEREFRRALELNRGYTPALHWYALHLVATGQPERAIATIQKGREEEPLSVLMTTASGRVLYFAHQYDASIAEYRSALEMDSGFVSAHLGLGLAFVQKGEPGRAIEEYRTALALPGGRQLVVSALLAHAYAVSGRKEEARALLRELSAVPEGRYVPAEYAALVHLGLGEKDAAIADLERAYRLGSGYLAYLRVEPLFDPLRSDPRFAALARRVGL
jgi:TolB-like protein/DNA-binding SARP family transcriptional activator